MNSGHAPAEYFSSQKFAMYLSTPNGAGNDGMAYGANNRFQC